MRITHIVGMTCLLLAATAYGGPADRTGRGVVDKEDSSGAAPAVRAYTPLRAFLNAQAQHRFAPAMGDSRRPLRNALAAASVSLVARAPTQSRGSVVTKRGPAFSFASSATSGGRNIRGLARLGGAPALPYSKRMPGSIPTDGGRTRRTR